MSNLRVIRNLEFSQDFAKIDGYSTRRIDVVLREIYGKHTMTRSFFHAIKTVNLRYKYYAINVNANCIQSRSYTSAAEKGTAWNQECTFAVHSTLEKTRTNDRIERRVKIDHENATLYLLSSSIRNYCRCLRVISELSYKRNWRSEWNLKCYSWK